MPASKSLSDFLPEVLPQVPGCLDIFAKNAVRNAAIEFCERSGVYTKLLDPMTIDAGVPDYELDMPDDTVIWKPLRVLVDGEPIEPKAPRTLDVLRPGWQAETGEVTSFHVRENRRSLRLVLTPDATVADGLVVEASLKPSKDASSFEVSFFEEYFRIIADGALAYLLALPNKPWTNTRKAGEALMRFNMACGKHAIEIAEAQANAPIRVQSYYDIG